MYEPSQNILSIPYTNDINLKHNRPCFGKISNRSLTWLMVLLNYVVNFISLIIGNAHYTIAPACSIHLNKASAHHIYATIQYHHSDSDR